MGSLTSWRHNPGAAIRRGRLVPADDQYASRRWNEGRLQCSLSTDTFTIFDTVEVLWNLFSLPAATYLHEIEGEGMRDTYLKRLYNLPSLFLVWMLFLSNPPLRGLSA